MAKRKKQPKLPRQPQMQDEAFQKRFLDLVSGKITAPNAYCKHIIEKLKIIDVERAEQIELVQHAKEAINKSTTRIVELQGQALAYAEDLRKFDKEIVADAATEKEAVS